MSQESTLKQKIDAIPTGTVLRVVASAYAKYPDGVTNKTLSKEIYASQCSITRWRNQLIKQYGAVFKRKLIKGTPLFTLTDFQ